jgi:GDP/UDP-N,N'-diacetylbacillosamine 2-epimerase (hydrolysing)
MKKIFVLSVGRSDYDRYLPIINELKQTKKVNLHLIFSSAHYASKFGTTINYVDRKFKIIKPKKTSILYSDKPLNLVNKFAEDLKFLSTNINKYKPDILIVLGDRYEMLLGPLAATPFNLPVIHFYGGAVTEGAIDELARHAITKLSHYHFVALNEYRKRLIQLGEENWRIKVSGIHALDNLKQIKKINNDIFSKKINLDLHAPYLLMTFHPVTLELKKTNYQINSLIKAIKKTKLNAIITYPNADVGNEKIIKAIKEKLNDKTKYKIIKNCGSQLYLQLMQRSLAVIGNSSSGIVEAASFNTPAINIGTRQDGKFKPKNVINCNYNWQDIYKKIMRVKNSNKIKISKNRIKNPYESKISIKNVVKLILSIKNNDKIIRKKFINIK